MWSKLKLLLRELRKSRGKLNISPSIQLKIMLHLATKDIFLILQMKELRPKWLYYPHKIVLLVSSTEVLTHSYFDAQTTGTCEEVWPKAVVLILRKPGQQHQHQRTCWKCKWSSPSSDLYTVTLGVAPVTCGASRGWQCLLSPRTSTKSKGRKSKIRAEGVQLFQCCPNVKAEKCLGPLYVLRHCQIIGKIML